MYRYVISFSTSSTTLPGLVLIDSDGCSNIEVTSLERSEPSLYGNLLVDNTVIQPLNAATAALFSPGRPLVFINNSHRGPR